jgi:hypothetical protein
MSHPDRVVEASITPPSLKHASQVFNLDAGSSDFTAVMSGVKQAVFRENRFTLEYVVIRRFPKLYKLSKTPLQPDAVD